MKLYQYIIIASMMVVAMVGYTYADTAPKLSDKGGSFELIPKVDSQVQKDTYSELSKSTNKHKFWDTYNTKAGSEGFTVKEQLATGVMNRDTLIEYAAIIIQYISSLGLVVGAGFVIYSGYQYATSIFSGKEGSGSAIKYAFIGIAIITSSFGIFRLLFRIFIE